MKVKAIEKGYYGNKLQYPGDVFFLQDEKHFSKKWMEKFVDEAPVEAAPEKKDAPVVKAKGSKKEEPLI